MLFCNFLLLCVAFALLKVGFTFCFCLVMLLHACSRLLFVVSSFFAAPQSRQIAPYRMDVATIWAFWGPGLRCGANEPQKACFEHFEALAWDVVKMSPRRLVLSILRPWPGMWRKWAPEGLIWAFEALAWDVAKMSPRRPVLSIWKPWPEMWRKWAPEGLLWAFWAFQALAPELARTGPRGPILSIFKLWPRNWPEQAPKDPFWAFGHFLGQGPKTFKISLLRPILATSWATAQKYSK